MSSLTEQVQQRWARALLDSIAATEADGYNRIYGKGGTFSDFSDHPRKNVPIESGPNKGKTSSAAGRYQFLKGTWDEQKSRLGLTDFSPQSQDKAALDLAARAYKRKTGRDLSADLQSDDPKVVNNVGRALSGTWTSLPSGIEQNGRYGKGTFYDTYAAKLGQRPAQDALPQANDAEGLAALMKHKGKPPAVDTAQTTPRTRMAPETPASGLTQPQLSPLDRMLGTTNAPGSPSRFAQLGANLGLNKPAPSAWASGFNEQVSSAPRVTTSSGAAKAPKAPKAPKAAGKAGNMLAGLASALMDSGRSGPAPPVPMDTNNYAAQHEASGQAASNNLRDLVQSRWRRVVEDTREYRPPEEELV